MPRNEEPVLDEFEWDHDLEGSEAPTPVQPIVPIGPRTSGLSLPSSVGRLPSQIRVEHARPAPTSERTPLLRKISSLSSSRVSRRQALHDELELDASQKALGSEIEGLDGSPSQKVRLTRKKSSTSSRSEKAIVSGKSTFGQTLFNSIAILLGFGMLAEPLAFAYAGWIGGTILIIFYGTITCYTAKILARIMADDPQIRTYADIGNKAFGQRSRLLTSSLFCLELFTVGVVLVTLFGDSLHSILPIYSSGTYKIMGLAVLIPSVFCPLSLLSYASILGILSTLLIIGTVFIDGLSKSEAPGSLWDPAPTNLGIAGWGELGVAFGLFMAGFSGHAVLPSLAKDMANPKEFDEMINLAFIAATVVYTCIGGGGYLMFGNSVSDEVSKDLLATPGYNVFLNKLAIWSLVIMPLTKFALSTRPVIITLEIFLGLEGSDPPQLRTPETPGGPTTSQIKRAGFAKDVLILIERSAFTCLSVAVSIFIPEFSSMMAFVGSFSAFMLCVIGPVAAKICLERRCGLKDGALMVIAIVMATWGTIAALAA
ncbi:uncharacterized protein FOMMEDRAFT_82137 [Fomitiporia mediterranea MF3/22]|uniref:uncharacterized protein n=1 Tax=Fomitiporia mediterranea (strain MF3/22) TaxID=694068 RepID=UPI0004407990|nr:uncharacterized protein FOMMEDRAFT_82137 [Fomitiporia mediterranea MF3/22]EJD04149.1 hypothetical protein FOMMEDRAFT_82137 [Fomitiporia mediterranea MF3/22]